MDSTLGILDVIVFLVFADLIANCRHYYRVLGAAAGATCTPTRTPAGCRAINVAGWVGLATLGSLWPCRPSQQIRQEFGVPWTSVWFEEAPCERQGLRPTPVIAHVGALRCATRMRGGYRADVLLAPATMKASSEAAGGHYIGTNWSPWNVDEFQRHLCNHRKGLRIYSLLKRVTNCVNGRQRWVTCAEAR